MLGGRLFVHGVEWLEQHVRPRVDIHDAVNFLGRVAASKQISVHICFFLAFFILIILKP